jgi:hypothetical protein
VAVADENTKGIKHLMQFGKWSGKIKDEIFLLV